MFACWFGIISCYSSGLLESAFCSCIQSVNQLNIDVMLTLQACAFVSNHTCSLLEEGLLLTPQLTNVTQVER